MKKPPVDDDVVAGLGYDGQGSVAGIGVHDVGVFKISAAGRRHLRNQALETGAIAVG